MHIPVVPVDDVLLDLIEIAGCSFLLELIIAAFRPDCRACGQIYLHIGIRQNAGSDVAAIHDHIRLLCQIFLKFHEFFADLLVDRCGGSHVSDLLSADQPGHILAV